MTHADNRPWLPHVTVAAVVAQNDQFLLIEESTARGLRLNQPAGHWEPGETLIEAVIRETLEESAWHFEPDSLVGIYRHSPPTSDVTYLRFAFTGKLLSHAPEQALDVGIIRTLWQSIDTLRAHPEQHRGPMVLRCAEDYLAGQRHPLSLIHEFE